MTATPSSAAHLEALWKLDELTGPASLARPTERWACPTPAQQARAARADAEAALEAARWPWSRRLSLWLDWLAIVEQTVVGGTGADR